LGSVVLGSSATATFTVANTGGTAITITKSKPPTGGAFAATTSLSEGTTIAPGEILTEKVAFAPSVIGPEEATWVINGSGSDVEHKVRFSGVGVTTQTLETEVPTVETEVPTVLEQALTPSGPGPVLSGVLPDLESLAPPALPNIVIGRLALNARASGTIAIRVGCRGDVASCAGIATLRTLTAIAASAAATPEKGTTVLTLARASFAVAGGRAATVRLRLTAGGRALLAHVHALRARATIVAHDPAGATHTTRAIVTIYNVANVGHGSKG
jgi:hypothetical protein